MAQEDGVALIEGLPIQSAPQRTSVALPRLRTANRRQVALRAVDLETLVADEHRVRLVWSFVEGLDLAALYSTIKAVEGQPGHPPADPRILLALWLYATVQGIGSARELARLCEEHIAFQWLCGGVGMNAKTLGGLPGGAWRGAGAVAGRQLHRVAEDRRGEAGSRRPGWRAGACRCRGGVVPPAQHVGGLPAGGGRAGAPAARRTRAGPWRGQPATGGGAPSGGGRPCAARQAGAGGHRNVAGAAARAGASACRTGGQESRPRPAGRGKADTAKAGGREGAAGFDHRCR